MDHLEVDEHCQRLTVTVPSDVGPDDRLPVMVWIHGGSYVLGGGDLPIHDAHDLVTEQRVVVVTVTYRLGVLGFLGDGGSVPANLGLLELVEALRWVQRNIAAFGGDPEASPCSGSPPGATRRRALDDQRRGTGTLRRAIVQSAPSACPAGGHG